MDWNAGGYQEWEKREKWVAERERETEHKIPNQISWPPSDFFC